MTEFEKLALRKKADRHLHIAAELTTEANMVSDIIKEVDTT